MTKNYLLKGLLLAIPFTAFVLMSSAGGRDDGRTGSPGDGGNSCVTCHNTGGNFGANLGISTNIPAGGYALNTDYTITVQNSSSASTYGFQLTAENASNTKVGTFVAGSGSRVTGQRITHSSPSSSGTWTFTWKSPATSQGEVKFYAASVAANGNGNTSGDQVVTASTSGFGVLSASKQQQLDFEMYPNPAVSKVNIQLPTGVDKGEVSIYNYSGQLVRTQAVSLTTKKVNVQGLAQGMYLLKISADGKQGVKHFVKK